MIRDTLVLIFQFYELMILARVLMTWLPAGGVERSPFGQFLIRATEPLLLICREVLYSMFRLFGVDERRVPLDFSPILALGAVHLLRNAVMVLLR